MNKISLALIGLTLLCFGCAKNEKETPDGFKFNVIEQGDGVLPKTNDVIVFQYVLKDSKDSVWNETYSQGFPAAVPIGDSMALAQEKGIVQMFRMLSKGDSVKASMPIQKFFQDISGGPAPFKIDTTLTMSYLIRVTDIMPREKFQEYQITLMQSLQSKQKGKDADLIKKHLSEKNITAQTDTSGIAYVIHQSKGGPKPTIDNCVEVSYKGAFLEDGKVFDQAPQMAFPLNRVIMGWQRAIPLLGVGDSATFYIPSGLAYGPQGQPGSIPPNSILIFDVTLLGIGKGFDQNTGKCN